MTGRRPFGARSLAGGLLAVGVLVLGVPAAFALPGSFQSVSEQEGSLQDEGLVIRDALIVDGTGAAAFRGDVRVSGGRIVEVGRVTAAPRDRVFAAGGRVLAPGFIDTHSHHDRGLLSEPGALGAVSQGITTIVVGQDGGSNLPLSDFFRRLEGTRVAVNVASFVGHNTLRAAVMDGDPNRRATPEEIRAMEVLLREELAAGALGLATGLEYDSGIHSATEEVVALARIAGEVGGRYISHIRSEDRALFEAVDEALRVGREAGVPVQISHMKLAMRSLLGRAGELLERLEEARAEGVDVTADVYPYTAWQSTMTVLFPERDFEDLAAARFALAETVPPEGLLITRFDPDPALEGMTLAEIARARQEEPARTLLDLIAESRAAREAGASGGESVIGESMSEEDVIALLQWPHTNVSSDGGLRGGHPRGYGAFPRFLGRYVRELGVFELEEAIHRMTALSARHMGIGDRGVIRPGAAADLVLLDPDRVRDRATFQEPQVPSEGIDVVWVNGEEVFRDGGVTGARPGKVLRRGAVRFSGLDPRTEARIDSIFREFDGDDRPGCAVGVVEDGSPTFARGYGMAHLEHGVPLGSGSIFRMASVSKQFTAALTLLLERDGRISLDDEVRLHIPELPDYGTPLTIRHLVHHTSGLRDYLALMALAGRGNDDVYDEGEVVRIIARQQELNFPPGGDYTYSNSGYFLISELVRRVDGRTMAEYARDELLRPLGMYRSHFHDDHTRVVPGRAEGYAPRGDGTFRTSRTQLNMVGDGGLFTNLEELGRWEVLMQGALGEEHPLSFLPERMLERGVLTTGDTIPYAFGLVHGEHRGVAMVAHGGSFVGYRTYIVRFPDHGLSVQVLCNVASASPGELAMQVGEVLLEGVLQPRPDAVEEEARGAREEEAWTPAPSALSELQGDYWSEELGVTYRLRIEGDSLALLEPGSLSGALAPVAPDHFRRGGVRFEFIRGEDGSVVELRVAVGRASGIRFVPRSEPPRR
jgi:N-acyl-D-amino-acid deacylase